MTPDSRLDLNTILEIVADRTAAKLEQRLLSIRNVIPQRLLTIKHAAKYLGRSPDAVQHMVDSGKIPTVRGDRRIFIDLEDLNLWIEGNKRSCS